MYGFCTYIYHNFKPNADKYSIHGAYGIFNKIICWVPGIRFAEVSHVEQGRHPHTFPCHLNIQIHYSRRSNPLVVTRRGAIANRLTDFLIKLFSWELAYSLPAGTFWRCYFLISEGGRYQFPWRVHWVRRWARYIKCPFPFLGAVFWCRIRSMWKRCSYWISQTPIGCWQLQHVHKNAGPLLMPHAQKLTGSPRIPIVDHHFQGPCLLSRVYMLFFFNIVWIPGYVLWMYTCMHTGFEYLPFRSV